MGLAEIKEEGGKECHSVLGKVDDLRGSGGVNVEVETIFGRFDHCRSSGSLLYADIRVPGRVLHGWYPVSDRFRPSQPAFTWAVGDNFSV